MSGGIRAGGYRTYWTAHRRLRLESARRLAEVDAGRFPPGMHVAECTEIVTGWSDATLSFEGRARRTISVYIEPGSPILDDLCHRLRIPRPGRGEFGSLKSACLGRTFALDILDAPGVEVYVCADGTYLVVDGEEVHEYDSLARVEAEWQISTPEVVNIYPEK